MTTQLELPLAGALPARASAFEYLTIAEAAQRVRCCERTIRRAIDSGALRAGRIRASAGAAAAFASGPPTSTHGCSTMPRSSRQPTIERRSHRRSDGTTTDSWSVRYYDVRGVRRRRSFASVEEADFERARLALEAVAPITRATVVDEGEGSMLLRAFWQIWIADADSRLHPSTVRDHVRTWTNRVEPRFGDFELRQIKPRMVAHWRAELLAQGVGAESVRKAMGLLQAIYTVALEWGEATSNPVKVVRKPRHGRRRVVTPLPPESVEAIRTRMLSERTRAVSGARERPRVRRPPPR
jgi:excisionase family DNA binding protein